jgi:hypothetical protein
VKRLYIIFDKGDGTMKRQRISTTLLTVGALVLSFLFAPVGCAKDTAVDPVETPAVNTGGDTAAAKEEAVKTGKDQMAEKRKEILKEATAAIRQTQDAIKALDDKKNDDALAALERAAGKLEIILAREPELALAPSNVSAVTYNLLADIDTVKALRDEIEEALDDGRVQQARRLIRNLASERVVSITNIPLATYPDAIKLAVKRIDEGKIEEAQEILQRALNTLVVVDTIIPLPVVVAENLLKEAETLTENADRSQEENKRLATLLKGARTELEFAQALGYGSKKDFKNLYGQLDQIEEKTKGGKSGAGYFTKIKGYLEDALKSSQQESQGEQEE